MSNKVFSDVLVGSDGWLFLAGGSNEVLDLYTRKESFTEDMAHGWAARIEARAALSRSLGAQYLHVVAPEKLCVYRDQATTHRSSQLYRPANRVRDLVGKAGLSTSYLDLFDALVSLKSVRQAFMKTDTHWTLDGMRACFRVICARLGIFDLPLDDHEQTHAYESFFDLGSKLVPPIGEPNLARVFGSSVERTGANEIAALWDHNAAHGLPIQIHNSLAVSYRNSSATALNEVVVLFGDSYLDFRATTVTGLFAETFREVHFVWSLDVDYDFVRRLKPTIIVTEAAERFMRFVPSDTYNLAADSARRMAEI